MNNKNDDSNDRGNITVTITNEINGRVGEIHANGEWPMSKVIDRAYSRTKDEPRASDKFTGTDPNNAISDAQRAISFSDLTATNGYMPGERTFFIRGAVGGA